MTEPVSSYWANLAAVSFSLGFTSPERVHGCVSQAHMSNPSRSGPRDRNVGSEGE